MRTAVGNGTGRHTYFDIDVATQFTKIFLFIHSIYDISFILLFCSDKRLGGGVVIN